MHRSLPPLASLLVSLALGSAVYGCGGEDWVFTPASLTTDAWPPSPTAPESFPDDDPEPFDVRLAGMYPEALAGRERLCDLAFVGTLHGLRRDERTHYDPPVSHRATVRCRALSGEGWGDLVFPKTTAPLASFVRTGSRIRVAIRGHAGFDGYPVLEFVAQVAPTAPAPTRRRVTVPAGSDFAAGDPGPPRPCAIASAGSVLPLPQITDDASHRMLVTCRHPTGATTVEVRFPRDRALAALRMQLGEVVPLRVVSTDGPHVIAAYTGP